MSRKTIEICICDLCNKESEIKQFKLPVKWLTEQTEGRNVKPYFLEEQLDLCEECLDKVTSLEAWGAQGFKNFKLRKEIK